MQIIYLARASYLGEYCRLGSLTATEKESNTEREREREREGEERGGGREKQKRGGATQGFGNLIPVIGNLPSNYYE